MKLQYIIDVTGVKQVRVISPRKNNRKIFHHCDVYSVISRIINCRPKYFTILLLFIFIVNSGGI